jgi:Carbohydrate-binding module 48 (Isoamylase N-terminal domain)
LRRTSDQSEAIVKNRHHHSEKALYDSWFQPPRVFIPFISIKPAISSCTESFLIMSSPDPSHAAFLLEMNFDPKPVLKLDGYLRPNIPAIATRYRQMKDWQAKIDATEGGVEKFSRGYERFGLNVGKNNEVVYREWAPNAVKASLIGDFSMSLSP